MKINKTKTKPKYFFKTKIEELNTQYCVSIGIENVFWLENKPTLKSLSSSSTRFKLYKLFICSTTLCSTRIYIRKPKKKQQIQSKFIFYLNNNIGLVHFVNNFGN